MRLVLIALYKYPYLLTLSNAKQVIFSILSMKTTASLQLKLAQCELHMNLQHSGQHLGEKIDQWVAWTRPKAYNCRHKWRSDLPGKQVIPVQILHKQTAVNN